METHFQVASTRLAVGAEYELLQRFSGVLN